MKALLAVPPAENAQVKKKALKERGAKKKSAK